MICFSLPAVRRRLVLYSLLVLSTAAFSQQQHYNALLWKISGRGLSKPSYLYGTMHLTDKKLFQFSDSLYKAIESTDGFAAELDPELLMPAMLRRATEEIADNRPLEPLIPADLPEQYRKKLEKVMKKKIGKAVYGDLKNAAARQSRTILREGEMETFMDMYLLGLSRDQNKWTGGIEDVEDQLEVETEEDMVRHKIIQVLSDPGEMRASLDQLMQIYLSEKLDEIDLSSSLFKGADLEKLNRRNLKMARRIDSIMAIRTCFFAVGAAHIPGDTGVVNLLRQRGFTVSPVYAVNRIAPDQYKRPGRVVNWQRPDGMQDWYYVEMPGKATPLQQKNSETPFDIFSYFDLAKMTGYFTIGSPMPIGRNANMDSLYNVWMNRMKEKGKLQDEKRIAINGTTGREYHFISGKEHYLIQVFIVNNHLVMNMAGGEKEALIHAPEVAHFMNSFRITADLTKTHELEWKLYSFPQSGFQIRSLPRFKFNAANSRSDSATKVTTYTVQDNAYQLGCWMMVIEAQRGYYFSTGDSAYFKDVSDNLKAAFNVDTLYITPGEFKGYPKIDFLLHAMIENTAIQVNGMIVNRGNRKYYLYAVSDTSIAHQSWKNYISSFDFLSMKEMDWKPQQFANTSLQLWLPEKPVSGSTDEEPGEAVYQSYDSVAPATVHIKWSFPGKFESWTTDSAYMHSVIKDYVSYSDSLVYLKTGTRNGNPQLDALYHIEGNHIQKAFHLELNRDTAFLLFTYVPLQVWNSDQYQTLMQSFRFSNPGPSTAHLKSKTRALLAALKDGDSTEFEQASSALYSFELTREDLPLFHQALLQRYRDFESNDYSATDRILGKIVELNDSSSTRFFQEAYPEMVKKDPGICTYLLSGLVKLKTLESFTAFTRLVKTYGFPGKASAYLFNYAMTDSLPLTATQISEWLPLVKDTSFAVLLPPVLENLLDSALIKPAALLPYEAELLKLAERIVNAHKAEGADAYDTESAAVAGMLQYLKAAESDNLLNSLLKRKTMNVKFAAASALLRKKKPVPAAELNSLAADYFYRLQLYDVMEKEAQLKLYPSKYLNQKAFAEAEVYQYASDDYSPDKISFIGEKELLIDGSLQRFFLFKVHFGEEAELEGQYLGLAGPYPKGKKELIRSSKYSWVYLDEPLTGSNQEELLKKMLEQLEEE